MPREVSGPTRDDWVPPLNGRVIIVWTLRFFFVALAATSLALPDFGGARCCCDREASGPACCEIETKTLPACCRARLDSVSSADQIAATLKRTPEARKICTCAEYPAKAVRWGVSVDTTDVVGYSPRPPLVDADSFSARWVPADRPPPGHNRRQAMLCVWRK